MNDLHELFCRAKEQLDIRDAAQRYGLTLDRSGRALCPFHADTHPSLSFKEQYFHCFACGAGGDVLILSIKLDTLTARILKLSSDGHSRIESAPLYSRRDTADR